MAPTYLESSKSVVELHGEKMQMQLVWCRRSMWCPRQRVLVKMCTWLLQHCGHLLLLERREELMRLSVAMSVCVQSSVLLSIKAPCQSPLLFVGGRQEGWWRVLEMSQRGHSECELESHCSETSELGVAADGDAGVQCLTRTLWLVNTLTEGVISALMAGHTSVENTTLQK